MPVHLVLLLIFYLCTVRLQLCLGQIYPPAPFFVGDDWGLLQLAVEFWYVVFDAN